MASDYEIQARIEVLLQGQAETRKQLDDLDKGGKRVEKTLGRAGEAVTGFGRALIGVFSAAVIGNFARQSFLAFAEFERTIGAIRIQLQNLGIDADINLPKIIRYLESIAASGGPGIADTSRAFQKFIGITRDVNAALALTTLASNLAKSGLTEGLSPAVSALSSLMQGRATEAANALGLALRDQSGRLKTAVELFDEVVRSVEDMETAFDDARTVIDKNASAWEQLKLTTGSVLGGIVGFLDRFGLSLDTLSRVFENLRLHAVRTFLEIGAVASGFGRTIAAALDFNTLAKGGAEEYLRGIKGGFAAGRAEFADEIAKNQEDLVLVWGSAGFASGKAYEEGLDKARGEAGGKEKDRAAREAAKAAEKAAEEAKKIAERKAQIERDAEDQLLAERIKATEEWSAERERLEVELLQRMHARAIGVAREAKASEAAINETFRVAEGELHDRYLEERGEKDAKALEKAARERLAALEALFEAEFAAAEENNALREELEVERLLRQMEMDLQNKELTDAEKADLEDRYQKRIFNLRKRFRKADLDQERAAAMTKLELVATIMQQTAGIAMALFGQNKSIAIAAAIIDTIGAAIKAYQQAGGGWWGIPVMLFTLATGYAKIREMRKATPASSGFDDPTSDRAAYLAGRRWANDMLAKATAGWNDGLAGMPMLGTPALSAPGTAPPVAAMPAAGGSGQTVNVYGNIFGGDAGLRELRRELDRAYRRDAPRRIRA